MSDPAVPVGFDYAAAILEIHAKLSYSEICDYVGYESRTSIYRTLEGVIPAHPQGEAIYSLYRELFERDPPMSREQAIGRYE